MQTERRLEGSLNTEWKFQEEDGDSSCVAVAFAVQIGGKNLGFFVPVLANVVDNVFAAVPFALAAVFDF